MTPRDRPAAHELRGEALRILADLVAFPTLTSTSNLELIAYATELLERAGGAVVSTFDETGRKANLFATLGPAVDGGVVLSGHTDVVPADGAWEAPPFVASQRDGRVYGRGTADMKGFVACALALAPRFAAAGLRAPVHIALTYDEEVGCRGAPLLLAELARTGPRPRAAIVGEPTMLRVIAAHKGCFEYTTTITGVEGHASAPRRAVNAVEYAARYLARLDELRAELSAMVLADSPYGPPETTISVGTISGGTARNVAAGECRFDWEMRPIQRADAEHARGRIAAFERELLDDMRRVAVDAAITTVTVGAVDGLEARQASAAVELARALLDDPEVDVAAFSTEAGLYQRAGIPAIVCGPGSIDVAHRPDEYLSLAQVDACLAMLGRLERHLSGGAAP